MVEPIATIKQGQLKGAIGIDLNGEQYLKFLGIPYAKPPVGPLRFKAPQPAEPWTGVLDATKDGSPCLAPDLFTFQPVGSEDCLYLNVFTKELPKESSISKPVMVFIHGGGFIMGNGGEKFQGGKYLVAEDVVLVTLNYRLGIWGFLSSDDLSLEIPGNATLKDQTLALKWVQENISSFGGDPNNVTIFGVSAGAGSVSFQVLSPTAKGLFHKAIAQSGVALNPWAWGQKNAIQVAEKLGKKVSSDKEALDILMDASADEVLQASLQIRDDVLNSEKRRPFGPVIEKPNPTAFLTENPSDMLAAGNFNQVPTIYGLCSNEGLVMEFMKRFATSIKPRELGAFWNLGVNEEKRKKINSIINDYYFKNGETREAIYKIVGDVGFLVGIIETVKLTAKTSSSPVYLYLFDYIHALTKSVFTMMNIPDEFNGVAHGLDQVFLLNQEFPEPIRHLEAKFMEDNRDAIKKITKIWTDFARTGKPHEDWLPVTDVNELKYFHITEDPKLDEKPFGERLTIWESILKDIDTFDASIQENATN